MIRVRIFFCILVMTLCCDQFTKSWADGWFDDRTNSFQGRFYLGGVLSLQYVQNSGVFLGFGSNFSAEVKFWLFTVFASCLLGVIIGLIFWKKNEDMSPLGLSFIFAGGLGNLIDRVLHGAVTDFMILRLGIFRTGVFNFADVAIALGTSIVLIKFCSFYYQQLCLQRLGSDHLKQIPSRVEKV